jgi:SAM-dependent methyltransferase
MSQTPPTRWTGISGGGPVAAAAYQRRFDELAATGADVHGEAALVASLVEPPSRVLDAGCGTGRVATRLSALGYHCVGVDADADMLEVAQRQDPVTTWVRQDLSDLALPAQAFDLALMAGNVVPLLAPGTLVKALERLAAHLRPGGLLVAGFGLDAEHLPPGCPVTRWEDYDRACTVAELSFLRRYATWDRQRWHPGAGYVVSLHRLND